MHISVPEGFRDKLEELKTIYHINSYSGVIVKLVEEAFEEEVMQQPSMQQLIKISKRRNNIR
jgi:hypothetical protein